MGFSDSVFYLLYDRVFILSEHFVTVRKRRIERLLLKPASNWDCGNWITMVQRVDMSVHYNRTALAESLPQHEKHYYVEAAKNDTHRLYGDVKRFFDIILSLLGLILLIVPMFMIAAIVAVDSPGAPIYQQERLGRNGKPFTILKFRTMRLNAEERGPCWAKENDDRCTKTGRILRHSHMDELPQLWNILKGDMSFVGPRPERPCFYEEFEKYVHGFKNRLAVRPGLTGLAQINGGYTLLPEEKIVYDMKYINNCSLKMDLECIAGTFREVFKKDACQTKK
jgi:lipopolysaccharide/colanic/teichoic acid biosynthesis glycosyltransferase